MSLIHIYLDKNNNSNTDLIKLFKNHHVDFLQYNIESSDTCLKSYDLSDLPAAKFEKSVIYNINDKSVESLVEEFINFTETIPSSTNSQKTQYAKEETEEDKNQILMDTIKISNKKKLSHQVKNFSEKYKK